MYSKTMILFFGLALYLLECQGKPPTQKQREKIRKIVKDNVGQGGTGYEGLEDVLKKVVAQLNLSVEFPCKDTLLFDSKAFEDGMLHTYTCNEIRKVIADFVGNERFENGWTVKDCTEWMERIYDRSYVDGHDYHYKELYGIIEHIKSECKITKHFPTVDEHKLALSAHVHYTADEVQAIAIKRLF